jgi:hypothetical protein
MVRSALGFGSILLGLVASGVPASEITGHYLEARTCQVYTGPCFAAGEVGLTGKDAVMAWNIQSGEVEGVDLAGLKVALVVRSDRTIGFAGVEPSPSLGAVVLVDEQATPEQQQALVDFARKHAGAAGQDIKQVRTAPIDMQLDVAALTGDLRVGRFVTLQTRRAQPGDCICSNESAYYPPLAQLSGFVPGVTVAGEVRAPALGSHWSIPDTRTAYLGVFAY